MTDADDVQRIALSLPEATYDNGGFGIDKKGFAWFYNEKIPGQKGRVRRDDVLAIRVANEGDKLALLAMDPEKFFTTAHYNGYPAILVNLPAIDADELTQLLTAAWRLRAPRKLVKEFDAAQPESVD